MSPTNGFRNKYKSKWSPAKLKVEAHSGKGGAPFSFFLAVAHITNLISGIYCYITYFDDGNGWHQGTKGELVILENSCDTIDVNKATFITLLTT